MARQRILGLRGRRLSVVALGALALAAGVPAAGLTAITDINPNQSTLDAAGNPPAGDPDGASGGRVGGLARVPGNNTIYYAASEWGGIYKTTNSGLNWGRLNTHQPNATWDVEASSATQVYATSFFDGRAANSLAGINVSTDGGANWTHPATATAPVNSATYTCPAIRRSEPSAFGIGIRPDATGTVYIGTNCGVAISTDSGVTWTHVDPKRLTTPAGAGNAGNVWDVVVQTGGTVDVCGDDGHFRSTDGGANWTGGAAALPGGRCSIAVSPDEAYVLLVAASDNSVWESDDAGANWANRGLVDGATGGGRIPFVVTNQRADTGGNNVFDAWTGGVRLFRGGCTTPATPAQGGAARCPLTTAPWAGPFTRAVGAHDDAGDLVFDTPAVDACPELFSSDGGVYFNTDNGGDCQNPDWEQPNVTPHAMWLYTMAGVDRAGTPGEDLYFGTQDVGSYGAIDAAGTPTWTNRDCCDVFDMAADATRTVYTFFSPFRIFLRGANLAGGGQIPTNPPGTTATFNFPDSIDQYGNNQYIAVTSTGGYITTDITANPVVWTQLGAASTPAGGFCGVQAAVTGGTPTFYAQTQCIGVFETSGAAQLWQFVGTAPAGTWTRVDNNDGIAGGFGIFAVDPNNPNRLYASNMSGVAGPRMVFSTDGGTNWDFDTELDTMMTANGTFLYQTTRGPTSFTTFNGYAQPSLLAYDQENPNIIVAGGRDSGIFLSTDSGANWSLLTDPVNASSKPHLPRPWYAYFDHGEPINADTANIYVGTQGRGVWRISLGIPTVSAGGPYTTNEGQDVTLTATATDPDGQPLTFTWDFDNDGQFDDATGASPTFTLVGQDGVFPVSVKATDPDGAFRVASTTVTVLNVAPSILGLASNGPKPENSPITVSGTISDPGWLESLTATIDWGDGTPVQSISGTLENVRPNATLTFSVAHTYGDDGTFTARVCGSDDDTTTCQNIVLSITNVIPTAVIDETGTFLVNGIPTFIVHEGVPVVFTGRSFDPGSDDRTTTWDWGDGPPSPDSTKLSLNDPSFNPDPDPSPTINPRTVTDTEAHAFAEACFYTVTFGAADDDGGAASDTVKVIITGNESKERHAGYWQTQYRPRPTALPEARRLCYLAIVGFMSTVFNEVRDASTVAAAFDVLFLKQNGGSELEKLDRQLLVAWLNFANGAFDYTEVVNSAGQQFAAVMATAEAVRLNPASTEAQLRAQRNILQHLNGE